MVFAAVELLFVRHDAPHGASHAPKAAMQRAMHRKVVELSHPPICSPHEAEAFPAGPYMDGVSSTSAFAEQLTRLALLSLLLLVTLDEFDRAGLTDASTTAAINTTWRNIAPVIAPGYLTYIKGK